MHSLNYIYDILLSFDFHTEFGGVWSKHRAYANLCTNIARNLYCFSDLEVPSNFDEYH